MSARKARAPSAGMRAASSLANARALVAGARTVPEGRAPHSLHGYFLRPADVLEPLRSRVEIIREGRAFAARRVTLHQHGKPVFEMSCSFTSQREGDVFVYDLPAEEAMPPNARPARGVPAGHR